MLELTNLRVKRKGLEKLIQFLAETTTPASFRRIMNGSLDELDKCLLLAIRRGIEEFDLDLFYRRNVLSSISRLYEFHLRVEDQEKPKWFGNIRLQALDKEVIGVYHEFIDFGADEFSVLRQLWGDEIYYQHRFSSEGLTAVMNVESLKQRDIHLVDVVNTEANLLNDAIQAPLTRALNGTIQPWLEWYHAMNAKGHRCTLKDVAELSGWSQGRIRYCHMLYQAEHNKNATEFNAKT